MKFKDIQENVVHNAEDAQLELDVKLQDVGHGLLQVRSELLTSVGRESPLFIAADKLLKDMIRLQKEWKLAHRSPDLY